MGGGVAMLTKLVNKVWVVAPDKPPRYPYANCMYIDGEKPIVIDMGAGSTAFADIPVNAIDTVLISHFHFDHIHGDKLFTKAGFYAGYEERDTYTCKDTYIAFHGYDLWEELMPGIAREAYGQVIPLEDDVLVQPGFRNFELAGTFRDGTVFHTGQIQVTAVHLPGHTAGHYGFYLETENILFSGDIDLAVTGPWYSSNSADVGQLIASVNRIKEINPRILVTSHRRVLTEGILKGLDDYIGVVLKRHNKIIELLKEPMDLDQIAAHGLVFPERRNNYELFWEKMTIRNHIRSLLAAGLVIEIEKGVFGRK